MEKQTVIRKAFQTSKRTRKYRMLEFFIIGFFITTIMGIPYFLYPEFTLCMLLAVQLIVSSIAALLGLMDEVHSFFMFKFIKLTKEELEAAREKIIKDNYESIVNRTKEIEELKAMEL